MKNPRSSEKNAVLFATIADTSDAAIITSEPSAPKLARRRSSKNHIRNFTPAEIDYLRHNFDILAPKGKLEFEPWKQSLGIMNVPRADHLGKQIFKAMASKGRSWVSFEEYVSFTDILTSNSVSSKAWYSFNMLDYDHKGYIVEADVELAMQSLFELWNILTGDKVVLLPEYSRSVYRYLDRNKDRKLSLEEYEQLYTSEKPVFPWWDWLNQDEVLVREVLQRQSVEEESSPHNFPHIEEHLSLLKKQVGEAAQMLSKLNKRRTSPKSERLRAKTFGKLYKEPSTGKNISLNPVQEDPKVIIEIPETNFSSELDKHQKVFKEVASGGLDLPVSPPPPLSKTRSEIRPNDNKLSGPPIISKKISMVSNPQQGQHRSRSIFDFSATVHKALEASRNTKSRKQWWEGRREPQKSKAQGHYLLNSQPRHRGAKKSRGKQAQKKEICSGAYEHQCDQCEDRGPADVSGQCRGSTLCRKSKDERP